MNLRTLKKQTNKQKHETSEQHRFVPYPHPAEFADLSSFAPHTTQPGNRDSAHFTDKELEAR